MKPEIIENFGVPYLPKALLSDYTSFRLGGPCLGMFFCKDKNNIRQTVKFCRDQNLPFALLGGGSNIVVSDAGVDVYVIRFAGNGSKYDLNGTKINVSACAMADSVAECAANNGLSGINYLSGIPGTIGGAVVGNAGAFGKQIGDVIDSVTVINEKCEFTTLPANDLEFAYRHSSLKISGDIVVEVSLRLEPADKDVLLKEREEILNLRREKHPDWRKTPCAGSFFQNVGSTSKAERRQSAGWYLEQSGAKTLNINGARVFEKHANIVLKDHPTKAQDVFDLSLKMAKMVKEKFGIDLIREVRFMGTFNNMPSNSNIFW